MNSQSDQLILKLFKSPVLINKIPRNSKEDVPKLPEPLQFEYQKPSFILNLRSLLELLSSTTIKNSNLIFTIVRVLHLLELPHLWFILLTKCSFSPKLTFNSQLLPYLLENCRKHWYFPFCLLKLLNESPYSRVIIHKLLLQTTGLLKFQDNIEFPVVYYLVAIICLNFNSKGSTSNKPDLGIDLFFENTLYPQKSRLFYSQLFPFIKSVFGKKYPSSCNFSFIQNHKTITYNNTLFQYSNSYLYLMLSNSNLIQMSPIGAAKLTIKDNKILIEGDTHFEIYSTVSLNNQFKVFTLSFSDPQDTRDFYKLITNIPTKISKSINYINCPISITPQPEEKEKVKKSTEVTKKVDIVLNTNIITPTRTSSPIMLFLKEPGIKETTISKTEDVSKITNSNDHKKDNNHLTVLDSLFANNSKVNSKLKKKKNIKTKKKFSSAKVLSNNDSNKLSLAKITNIKICPVKPKNDKEVFKIKKEPKQQKKLNIKQVIDIPSQSQPYFPETPTKFVNKGVNRTKTPLTPNITIHSNNTHEFHSPIYPTKINNNNNNIFNENSLKYQPQIPIQDNTNNSTALITTTLQEQILQNVNSFTNNLNSKIGVITANLNDQLLPKLTQKYTILLDKMKIDFNNDITRVNSLITDTFQNLTLSTQDIEDRFNECLRDMHNRSDDKYF